MASYGWYGLTDSATQLSEDLCYHSGYNDTPHYCPEQEVTYEDAPHCTNYPVVPMCDYRATCSAAYGGNPAFASQ